MSNVVVITSNLYRPHIGGVENSLYHLAESYKIKGFKPVIVTSDIPLDKGCLESHEVQNGIEIYRYSMSKRIKFFAIPVPKSLSDLYSAVKMYRMIKSKYNPVLTITRYHFNQVAVKLAGISNSVYLVPGVVKFQNARKNLGNGNLNNTLQHYYHRVLQYWALKTSDRIAVFSMNMIKQVNAIVKQLDFPIVTKPGVDKSRFFPASRPQKLIERKQRDLEFDGPVFLCVGRCVKVKGFDIIIRALQHTKIDDYQLWIIGDGPLKSDLQSLADETGVRNRVKFLGSQPEPELYYRMADYFLMSSIYEPLGQTILEALSSGLPVVAFDKNAGVETATHELLNHNHGYLMNSIDEFEVAKSIDLILQKEESEYLLKSRACNELATVRYSWDKLADDLME